MEVFEGHQALFRPLARPAVALGNFDGVHAGHRALFAAAIEAAGRLEGDAVGYTFEPHPAKVLAPALAPPLLTTLDRRLELIAAAGIDACVVEPFTPALAAMEPAAFVESILVEALGARVVVVGYDFTYGRRRQGTTDSLARAGERIGFETIVVDRVEVAGIGASSTKVRSFLAAGQLEGARLLLGRDHDIDGVVVHGAGRGRSIGVPTANVQVITEVLPQAGVYAVRARLLDDPGDWLPGVANLGSNPTFTDSGQQSLEVHLFDFERDVYDQRVRVAFVERLRGERRFESVEALVAQIRTDAADARRILGNSGE